MLHHCYTDNVLNFDIVSWNYSIWRTKQVHNHAQLFAPIWKIKSVDGKIEVTRVAVALSWA